MFKWVPENDREYARLGQFLYGLPIDEMEQERLDINRTKYLHILDGKLCLAPIGESPQQILNLRTGTGMGHRHCRSVSLCRRDRC